MNFPDLMERVTAACRAPYSAYSAICPDGPYVKQQGARLIVDALDLEELFGKVNPRGVFYGECSCLVSSAKVCRATLVHATCR